MVEIPLKFETVGDTKATARWRSIVAAVIGTWLEYYDFTVYGLFAIFIGKAFFPVESTSGQLLLSFATFGIGFVARPLGALLFGIAGDRLGPKATLPITILLMVAGTALIALTPGYATIGVAAPALVVLGRVLQGLSIGGEAGVATTYTLSVAPASRRGLYGAWLTAAQGVAGLTASLLGFGLSSVISPEAMAGWGWRVPFLVGLLIGPVGIYLRTQIPTPAPSATMPSAVSLLRSLVIEHRRIVVIGFLTIPGSTISSYLFGQYMTTYAIHTLNLPSNIAMLISVTGTVVFTIFAVLAGWLSDLFGRRLLMVAPRVALVVVVYPVFVFITEMSSPVALLLGVGILSVFQAMSGAASLVGLAEALPRSIRTSALSIVFATGVALFGGTAQFVATWILDVTGDPLSLTWYVIAMNLVTVVALLKLRPAQEGIIGHERS